MLTYFSTQDPAAVQLNSAYWSAFLGVQNFGTAARDEAMTELLLPALRLSDPASLIDARQRSPIPESSRIRAFALTTGAPSPSSTQSQRPVLAKDILDGDVPVTAFSSRSAFGDADQLHPVSLFTDTFNSGDLAERSHILQPIDQKVAKMMRLHIMTRPSWGASSSPQKNPARRSLSPPGLGLAVQPLGPTECSSESPHEGDEDPDSSSSCAESPPPAFDNAAEVTNVTNHRQQAGAKKLVIACCVMIECSERVAYWNTDTCRVYDYSHALLAAGGLPVRLCASLAGSPCCERVGDDRAWQKGGLHEGQTAQDDL